MSVLQGPRANPKAVEHEALIIEMYAAGETQAAIARRTGIPRGSLAKILRKLARHGLITLRGPGYRDFAQTGAYGPNSHYVLHGARVAELYAAGL